MQTFGKEESLYPLSRLPANRVAVGYPRTLLGLLLVLVLEICAGSQTEARRGSDGELHHSSNSRILSPLLVNP